MQWWYDLSEIVRNLGLVLGAAVGIYIACQRVQAANKQAEAQIRQAALARRDHVAELFNRAVGQLKDEKLEVRLGAILTLGQVCRDFDDLSADESTSDYYGKRLPFIDLAKSDTQNQGPESSALKPALSLAGPCAQRATLTRDRCAISPARPTARK